MNISSYADYFHDGSIIGIQQKEDTIMISMESSEMFKDDLKDEIILSEHKTIKGILHLEKIISINENRLQMLADTANILDFELDKNKVRLFIEWINYPPKKEIVEFSDIVMEAKKIFWENKPDLFDPFRL